VETPGLKIVFGTDAVAGGHGRKRGGEFIDRVRDGGVDPWRDGVANSLGAEALGMGGPDRNDCAGVAGVIIALDGDPLKDITAGATGPSL